MSFITKKEDGKITRIPLAKPHPAISAAIINQKAEPPSNKGRKIKHISSVLLRKSANLKNKTKEQIDKQKEKQAEKKKQERIKMQEMNFKIDEIIDNTDISPKKKFRTLQRFAVENRKDLTTHQIQVINQELMDIDLRNDLTDDEGNFKKSKEDSEKKTRAEHDEDIRKEKNEKKTSKDKNPEPVTFAELEDDMDTQSRQSEKPDDNGDNLSENLKAEIAAAKGAN